MLSRLAVCGLALVALFLPRTGPFLDAGYSSGLFPWLQRGMTTISNLVPFALFDLLILVVLVLVVAGAIRDASRRPTGWRAWTGRFVGRLATVAAVAYLAFLVMWGFNYRRLALTTRMPYDTAKVTPERLRHLADESVRRVNALYDPAHRERWSALGDVDAVLANASRDAHRALGARVSFVAARPKRTLLDMYFRRAGVAGMTDPYFLETLVASDLLVVEQPMVIAHEWGHLAGLADEGEANFAGFVTCLRGSALHQYSGWLSLYGDAVAGLPAAEANEVASALADGPRADLAAIRDRLLKQVNPAVSAVGWRVYDGYLKANRVDEGTASYATVVRLVLGTEGAGLW